MNLALKIAIGLVALLLLYMGLNLMFMPLDQAANFGLEVVGTLGLSSLRGDFGGMFVAGALMLSAGLIWGNTMWYLAVAVLMLMIAAGRAVGFVFDGVTQAALPPFISELVIAAILVLAHRRMGSRN